jgi:AcrR family transcriptional regulator
VSKALVHYHFKEKESLLQALAEQVGLAITGRARLAIDRMPDEHVLDSYWSWLDRELIAGDLQILRALADYDSERVRAVARRVLRQRRELATEHIALVFSKLGLVPRVPAELLTETMLAFIDGLVALAALEREWNPRPAFDVLWLALLTLAE